MKWAVFVILTFLPAAASLHAEEKKNAKLDEKAVDALVQKVMKDFEAPGVALAIVRGDQVVYLKGHGVRRLGQESPVTPDTLFAIASCTKAFTATAIGFLVQEGRMDWDDPVRKHLPGYRMSDPLAECEVTIRDLLCHRTGVIRHDILWLVHPWDRDELIRRAGFLRPDKSFRSEYGYNNFQYTAAGEASARAAGMPWEQLVRERILSPLGMKATNFSIRDLEKNPDHARPHARLDHDESGPIRPIEPEMIDPMAPAGAINSNVRDLSAWMRFQLAEGKWKGKTLLKADILRQTRKPQVVVPIPDSAKFLRGITVQNSYGLGWQIFDYRGRQAISHGGSLDGYRSSVLLLPDEQVGIAVLTNLDSTSLPQALTYSLIDLILEAPPRDWNALILEATADSKAKKKETEEKLKKERKPDTKPSLPLSRYAGVYSEPAHGEIRITEEGGALTCRWGKFTLPVEHWHFDTFRLKEPPILYEEAFGDRLLLFRLSKNGEVEGFAYLGHEFKKAKGSEKKKL